MGLVLPACNYVCSFSTAHFFKLQHFVVLKGAVSVYSYGGNFRIRGVEDISEH